MSETTSGNQSERFKTFVTVLIALVSTVIALVASQSAVYSGNSTEAQHNGVLAKINLERVDGGSRTQLARNLRAFDGYRFNRSLYGLTSGYIAQVEEAGNAPLGTRLRLEAAGQLEESNLAYAFVESGYLLEDESGEYVDFDEAAYLNDRRQQAAIYQDVTFADDFEEAVQQRTESLALGLSLVVWFISLMFITWAEMTRSVLRWVWLGAGVLLALATLGAYAFIGLSRMLGWS